MLRAQAPSVRHLVLEAFQLAFCPVDAEGKSHVCVGKVGRAKPRGRRGRAAVLREHAPSVYQLVPEAFHSCILSR